MGPNVYSLFLYFVVNHSLPWDIPFTEFYAIINITVNRDFQVVVVTWHTWVRVSGLASVWIAAPKGPCSSCFYKGPCSSCFYYATAPRKVDESPNYDQTCIAISISWCLCLLLMVGNLIGGMLPCFTHIKRKEVVFLREDRMCFRSKMPQWTATFLLCRARQQGFLRWEGSLPSASCSGY